MKTKAILFAAALLASTSAFATGAQVTQYDGCYNIPGPDGSFFSVPNADVSHSVGTAGGQSMWHCKGQHPYALNRAVRVNLSDIGHSCFTPHGSTSNGYVQFSPGGQFHLRCSL